MFSHQADSLSRDNHRDPYFNRIRRTGGVVKAKMKRILGKMLLELARFPTKSDEGDFMVFDAPAWFIHRQYRSGGDPVRSLGRPIQRQLSIGDHERKVTPHVHKF
jgi:hypothetical protein